ncbi:MAG: ABC transporter permease [Williamsia sp.]|nr:ABC transporter permease [Williamsia sp.]
MLKNHLKIAWRTLLKNKGLSAINILGLGIGLAFAIVIGLWVQYERSFDGFHQHANRIGLVRKHTLFNNEKGTTTAIPMPLYDELKTNYPEVRRVTRMDFATPHSLVAGEKKFSKTGSYVDPDFLKMFSFPLVEGNVESALKEPNSIVLSRSLAKALFGSENAIGKTIKIDNQYSVMVTAVAEDVPHNSSFQFEFLAPFEFQVQHSDFVRWARTRWGNNFLTCLVEAQEGASLEALSKKIGPLIMQRDNTLKNQHLFLQPLKKVHLHGDYKNWANAGGRIEYVRLFGVLGIFVLLIACINFMNLSTAHSEKRAKEVGIRKAVGSRRGELIVQFLTESILTTFFAFLFSLAMIQLILPLLKELGFEHIRFDFSDVRLIGSLLAICFITGIIAGSYPAFYLSSFMPLKALKGRLKQGKGGTTFRKVLVVSQFVISISLIISTVIVFQQIRHAKDRALGYEPNNLITLTITNDIQKNYQALKQELLSTGYINSVSRSSSPMTGINSSWNGFSWEGSTPTASADAIFDVIMTDLDYEKTAGLQFIVGRPFSRDHLTDSSAVILNEAALKVIGYQHPVGKVIKLNNQPLTIIGVTRNMVTKDPFQSFTPTVFLFNSSTSSHLLVRLKEQRRFQSSLAAIQPIIERNNPAVPFEYSFVDEEFARKFTIENQTGKLAAVFAVLAIFISCLGLLGLASFMAECRAKEIGIRKVLGASIANLWLLLSKEFVMLVILACVIAAPLAFWVMQHWLAQYEYRIEISWLVFVLAGVLSLLITLATVSFQSFKAALINPINSLRSE